jgi:hypothetical protein
MKKFFVLPLVLALALSVSCQKQQTEEEKKAEVERQVQERLAAERLAQQQAEEDAKAVANKEAASKATPAETQTTETEETTTETSETRTEAVSTASYGVFFEKLEPHGAWRETTTYGYVWQPREAEESQDWRPYTEGRWAYSDAGWTWISDEPFGWATYHYGRWVRLKRLGWVWVPGTEWAPAWVSWRTNKNYVGWAPLPPEARFDRSQGIHNWADSYYDIGPDQYAFVRGEEFGSQHVRRSLVSAEQNVTIVLETTNVTNITFSNTTVINQGPNYDEIRTRSRQPLERYRLRRHFEMNDDTRSTTVRGDEIEIATPELRNVTGFLRPRTIKERVSEVTIDNGWTSVKDQSAAERARARMRTEATPPPNAPPKKFRKPSDAAGVPPASPTVAATAPPAASPVIAATVAPAPIATIAPTPRPSATVTLPASPTPRVRQSPGRSPRATLSPASSPSPASAAAPTATPAIRPVVSPPPSATMPTSIQPHALSSSTPAAEPSAAVKPDVPRKPGDVRSPRPLPRQPVPSTTTAPGTTVEQTAPPPAKTRPTFTPPVNRPTPLPRMTPATPPPVDGVVPPSIAPVAPPKRVPPRITPPAVSPPPVDGVVPPSIAPVAPPKRMPPRITPPAVSPPPADNAPAIPPKGPPANDQERPRDKKPKPPGPLDGAIVTPPPSPTPAPR